MREKMKSFNGYDSRMLVSEYLRAVVDRVLELPPGDSHLIEVPWVGVIEVTPAWRDEWVNDTRLMIADLEDIRNCDRNVPIGSLRD